MADTFPRGLQQNLGRAGNGVDHARSDKQDSSHHLEGKRDLRPIFGLTHLQVGRVEQEEERRA